MNKFGYPTRYVIVHLRVYTQKVEQCIQRRFSNYTDVFWAFLGIPKQFRAWFTERLHLGFVLRPSRRCFAMVQMLSNKSQQRAFLPMGDGGLTCFPIPSW